MYEWGYIVEATLAKLGLEEQEADELNLKNKFYIYANEAITQISSSIKPNRTFAEFDITENDIGVSKEMPTDFISFGDDVCTRFYFDEFDDSILSEAYDDDYTYNGYNKVIFWKVGKYRISYNARWYTFTPVLDLSMILPIPADILDCLPSYIASQCLKIDDANTAAVLRNEYEMFLARIDNTDYKRTKSIKIGGDW